MTNETDQQEIGLTNPSASDRELSKDELSRYSRQISIPEIGVEGQEKLKQSKVLVVGLGGLGTAASTYLAMMGIGHIGLVDFDLIELSNLNRQFLYSPNDVGKKKSKSQRKN